MKFYKVKKQADQTRKNKTGSDILICGELYTEKEVKKMNFTEIGKEKYFDIVEMSKFSTHWFFGARFENSKE